MTTQAKSTQKAWHELALVRAALFFVFLAAILAMAGIRGTLTWVLVGAAVVLGVVQVATLGQTGKR